MQNQKLPQTNKQPSFTLEQIEAAKKIIFSAKFAIEFSQMIQKTHHISKNKMMYDIFTPFRLKLWHKLMNQKPWMKQQYKPNF